MKNLKWIPLLLLALISLQCEAQNSKSETSENSMKKSMVQKIELEEVTRGSRRVAVFTPQSAITNINGLRREYKLTAEEWADMEKKVSAINLEKMESYVAPTTARYYDGALAAVLRITGSDGKEYHSQGFDAGKPPKELASLYNLLAPHFKKK